jgi:benzoylformate decarboxylase
MDLQMEKADHCDMTPIRLPDTRVRPPKGAIQEAAKVLLEAKHPVVLAGSRVTERSASGQLVALIETLGAPVISEPGTTHGRLAIPAGHPLNAQGLPLWSPEVRDRLKEFDTLFVVGMDLLRQYVYHEPSRAIPEHLRIVHLDEDPWQLGKNYPIEVGILSDTKTGLVELTDELVVTMTDDHRKMAGQRIAFYTNKHRNERERFRQNVHEEMDRCADARPISSMALMGAVAEALPPNSAVIEAAVTTTNTTLERLGRLDNVSGYFGHRGWTLGWGLGVTIGTKLAWPERPVLGILGEGAAMYGIQGLWTAARYNIPAVFLICNNAQYQILKIGAKGLNLPHAIENKFNSLDLQEPEIDFVSLSKSLGVDAVTVECPSDVTETIRSAFDRARPMLINVPIERTTPDRLNYG